MDESSKTRLQHIVKALGSAMDDVRDEAFCQFRDLLKGKECEDWTDGEYRKLWKGLFYGMWNLDGEIPQLEMAKEISSTITDNEVFTKNGVLFWKAFLTILRDEWMMIDQHRLDKYYSLARWMLHATFCKLLRIDWSERGFSCCLESEIISSEGIVSSLPSHFVEIYLEELEKACSEEKTIYLPQHAFVTLLYPFKQIMNSTKPKHSRLKAKIKKCIFDPLLDSDQAGLFNQQTTAAFMRIVELMELEEALDVKVKMDQPIEEKAQTLLQIFLQDQKSEQKQEEKRTRIPEQSLKKKKTKQNSMKSRN